MQVIKFRDETINGADESTLQWTEATSKEELMVEVFTSEELFEDLSMYWKKLQKRTDSAVYMTYEWAYKWWKHFGKNKQRSLFVVTVWDGTKLVGVAPFYKGYSAFGSLKLETRLQIIGSGGNPNEQLGYLDDDGISDFLDFIVDPSYVSPVADLLAEDVMTHSFLGVDVIKLQQTGDDSFIMTSLVPRLQNQLPEMKIEQSEVCPYIDLGKQKSLQGYIENQKPTVRSHLRQTLCAEGPGREYIIEDVTGSIKEVGQAAEDLIKLHQNRWNRFGFPGVFYDDRFVALFKDILKDAFENDWLWFKQAKDVEGVCASRLVLRYNNRFYDFITGFDDQRASSEYRPDIGLLIDLIRDGIAGDIHRIELLSGDEEYKYDVTSYSYKNWSIRIPLRKKKLNIPWLLNRIGAFWHKYTGREKRLMNIQRRQNGIIKMLWSYISLRWKTIRG